MNPYRILKTDNGYEIVRVSYDENGRPKSFGPLDFVSTDTMDDLEWELMGIWMADSDDPLTYADFKREG